MTQAQKQAQPNQRLASYLSHDSDTQWRLSVYPKPIYACVLGVSMVAQDLKRNHAKRSLLVKLEAFCFALELKATQKHSTRPDFWKPPYLEALGGAGAAIATPTCVQVLQGDGHRSDRLIKANG
jgi:hypothetical protein